MPETISALQSALSRLEAAPNAAPPALDLSAINESQSLALPPLPGEGESVVPAFADLVGDFVSQVNQAQQRGDSMVEALALGEPVDVHQVMLALNEARSALNLTLQVRAHVLKAYQDLMQIPL